MNNLSNHTTSLKLSKRLKELGFPQESFAYWSDTRKSWKEYNQTNGEFIPFEGDDSEIELCFGLHDATLSSAGYNDSEPMSAFLASELGEWLPGNVVTYGYDEDERLNYFSQLYVEGDWSQKVEIVEAKTMADTMAKMLIHLTENNLINPKELSNEK